MLNAHKGTCTNAFIVFSHNIYSSELSRLNDVLCEYTNKIMYDICDNIIGWYVCYTGEALLAAFGMTSEVWITRKYFNRQDTYILIGPSLRMKGTEP